MRIGLVYKKIFLCGVISSFLLGSSFGLVSEEIPISASDNQALSDPTKPSDFVGASEIGKVKKLGKLRLEAIIISDARRVAIINQKILGVGDTIGSKTVIAIDNNQVVLREGTGKDKKETVLPLWDRKMKDESL